MLIFTSDQDAHKDEAQLLPEHSPTLDRLQITDVDGVNLKDAFTIVRVANRYDRVDLLVAGHAAHSPHEVHKVLFVEENDFADSASSKEDRLSAVETGLQACFYRIPGCNGRCACNCIRLHPCNLFIIVLVRLFIFGTAHCRIVEGSARYRRVVP